ncbi:MAG: zinc ABC transporter substrate-binding protein [Paracoccaceae bacterium]|nr:zinc ABC transporter substrate-binding protein [Paracoccaceae bacterium]
MSKNFISLAAGMAMIGGVAMSDTPKVAVDISPVHSLVSRVMHGVGTPDLIVQAGASPHGYTLRPSEAKALQDAQMVFWMGESLSPWMEGALDTLSSDATIITLLERDETILLEFREGALFEEHDHDDHGDEKHDDHGDENHDDHGDEKHDDHGDEKHDDHSHGSYDPHAWLSPDNARIWLNLIASQLSIVDPENAGTYFANAAAGRLEIEALKAEVNSLLEPVRGKKFIVFHDAYQYFEEAFKISASGAISLGDASKPSPARIAEIQGRIEEESIDCVLSEPQFNKGLVATVMAGSNANTNVIDPLGVGLKPGPNLYNELIRDMTKTLVDCFES